VPVIKTANRRPLTTGKAAVASIATLLILAFLLHPQKASASPQGAEKAYKKGDYALAVKEYKAAADKSPEDRQLQFNLGAAAYKNKDYKEASNALRKALATTELSLQNRAYYNLGNTLYRQGQGTEKSNPQTTIKQWQTAVDAYEGALKLNPKDKDARFNQEFVKKKLEELKKKQKQDKKKNKGKGKNKDKDKNKNQGNKQAKNQDKKDKKGPGQVKPHQLGQNSPGSPVPRRRKPGQMSKEEAKNLLDSLKGDEKAMPIFAKNRGQGRKQDEKKRRDW
jgi:Ca-activated chloride channel family protein